MANGLCGMLWLKRVLEESWMPIHIPIKLCCDNKVVIIIAQKHVQHDRMQHVEINNHPIKKNIECGAICLSFVPST